MKVTNGWISNSSSSSFIVKCKGEKTIEFCKELLMKTWGYLNLENVDMDSLAKQLYDNMEKYEGSIKNKWDWVPITKSEVNRYKKNGYILYEVWVSDHDCDSNGIHLPDEVRDKLPSAGDGCLECDWGWNGNRPDEVIEYESQH